VRAREEERNEKEKDANEKKGVIRGEAYVNKHGGWQ
jgi:hypothetical protein